MSAARSSLLGRQAWRSLYESLDFFSAKISPRPNSTCRSGLNYTNATFGRPSSYSSWSFPKTPKVYGYNVRRSFTSGGLLLIGANPTSSTTSTVVSTCTAAADSAIKGNTTQQADLLRLARQAWRRDIHIGRGRRRSSALARRRKSTKSATESGKTATVSQPKQDSEKSPATPRAESKPESDPEQHHNYISNYFHLPNVHLPHRPTKEEFLAAANGFWARMKVRFKWFSIRSMRPWNTDEWGAFLSFFLFGHLVWILVGTTTFVSGLLLFINTVSAQEWLAKKVGDYLTESAGLSVIFESAIVPRWKDGVISFRNVYVSRRPGQTKSSVSKGTPSAAAVAAAEHEKKEATEEDDGNYTQFDVTLNTVNVTLSFAKWWNGTGPLKDVEIKGIRGVIDRTSVFWSDVNVDPLSYRHEHSPGDFEIESFKMEDLLVTVHQPGGFRPYSVSIYSCELPQLRKQYLFYDLLSANHMSGSFDGSLFTIHPRQVHGVAAGQERAANDFGEPDAWKKFSRCRIDGLKIDHLNRGDQGPFGWIYEGNVDIVADVAFPTDDDDSITKVVSDFYDRLEEAVTSNRYLQILDRSKRRLQEDGEEAMRSGTFEEAAQIPVANEADPKATPVIPDPDSGFPSPVPNPDDEPPRYLVMDLRIHLNDVKATVPVFDSHMGYVNQALVRPIVAYINAKKTYIPIGCRIVKRASDFDGAWSVFDCGLMSDVSAEVYDAFARDVEDQQSRSRRLKKVGFWTLSLAAHALFMGMAGNVV
ncbi:putative Mitochondrial distribution and morphology protein 31 [Seiridium cardinale]